MLDHPQLDTQALARLKLNTQPFLPPERCDDYFVTTALGMLINGVFQQLSGNTSIQVIKGEFGSGKTSFCHRLLCDIPAGVSVDLHSTDASHTINTLLHTLAGLNEPNTQMDTQELAVKAANRIFRQLHDQQQPALLIDDAHLLGPKALQTLFKFLSAIAKQDYGRLKLILVGERGIDETMAKINPSLLNPDDIYSALLRPLNRQDIEHYIRFRLERAGTAQDMPLTKKELAFIQSHCGGLPYKINRLTCEALNKRSGGFPGGKPFNKLFLGVAALIVTLALLIYWLTDNSPPFITKSTGAHQVEKNNEPDIQIPNKNAPATANLDSPAAETVATSASTRPENPILTAQANNNSTYSASDIEFTEKPDEVSRIDEPGWGSSVSNEELEAGKAALTGHTIGKVIEHPLSESWLASQPESYYMIQLAGTWNLESLLNFSRRLQVDKTLVLHRSLRNNQEWYVLLYGPFPDYAAAQTGIAELPTEVQSGNPWARSVTSFKKTL